jgi:hypothetical protein
MQWLVDEPKSILSKSAEMMMIDEKAWKTMTTAAPGNTYNTAFLDGRGVVTVRGKGGGE